MASSFRGNQFLGQPSDTVNNLFSAASRQHAQGNLPDAQAGYQRILLINPRHFGALHLLGVIQIQTGQLHRAVELISRALDVEPNRAEARCNIAMALRQLNRVPEALENLNKALKLNSRFPDAYCNKGMILSDLDQYEEAMAHYKKAIELKPDFFEAYFNLANLLKRLGKFNDAIENYHKCIKLRRSSFAAYLNLGSCCSDVGSYSAAIDAFDIAIKLNPHSSEALSDRGLAHTEIGNYESAQSDLEKSLHLNGSFFPSHYNRGRLFLLIERFSEALISLDKAIELKPDYAEAYSNRGNALKELNRLDEALASLDKAIELKPHYAEAYSNRGNVLKELNRLDEALISHERAISLNPDYAEAYSNRGNVLQELKRLDEALISHDRAISLKPDLAEAYGNRGSTLLELKRHDEALVSFNTAYELNPGIAFLSGHRLHTKAIICDWLNFDQETQELRMRIENNNAASQPFELLGLVDSGSLQRKCAEVFIKEKFSALQGDLAPAVPSRKDRITIGYFSADLRDHATAFLMAELFERHDHGQFKLIAFSFERDSDSEILKRMKPCFDAFHDVWLMSDAEVVRLARNEGVDIAVDLKGFTQNSRTGIFASRAAPIQINYLGYPGTMAADFIDYIVADRTLITPERQEHYSEKVVYLPHSYQPNDRKREIAERNFSREELGLPREGFVYCCFNNNWKITPEVFDIWMNALKETPASVLWLLEDNTHAAENLRQEAQLRGVEPHRIIFARRMSLAEHLARHRCADLFLDTLPYNAHTTASDALWTGLPVLTRMGESFASRVAASLLNAIGLPELITTSSIEYERMTIELAQYPHKLASMKRILSDNRLTMPLFNSELYAKHLEAAYTAMYERYQANLAPTHIYVDP